MTDGKRDKGRREGGRRNKGERVVLKEAGDESEEDRKRWGEEEEEIKIG